MLQKFLKFLSVQRILTKMYHTVPQKKKKSATQLFSTPIIRNVSCTQNQHIYIHIYFHNIIVLLYLSIECRLSDCKRFSKNIFTTQTFEQYYTTNKRKKSLIIADNQYGMGHMCLITKYKHFNLSIPSRYLFLKHNYVPKYFKHDHIMSYDPSASVNTSQQPSIRSVLEIKSLDGH